MLALKRFRAVVKSLLTSSYDLTNATPQFCISLLTSSNSPSITTLSKLHRKILNSNRRWIRDFIHADALSVLLSCIEGILNIHGNSLYAAVLLYKCLACVKELMNLKYGMEAVINMGADNTNCAYILAKACQNTRYQLVKKEIFQIFSGIGMYNEKGYTLAIQFLQVVKVFAGKRERFSVVVDEIRTGLNDRANVNYLTVLVGFINCLLSQPETLRERLNVRFELINLRINEILDQIKKLLWIQEDLLLQVELFEKFQLEDEFEGKGEYDLDNLNDAFQAICMRNQFSVKNSEQLLEILKLLFHIEEPNQENKWVQATDVLRKIVFFQESRNSPKSTQEASTQTEVEPETADIKKPISPLINSSVPPPPPPLCPLFMLTPRSTPAKSPNFLNSNSLTSVSLRKPSTPDIAHTKHETSSTFSPPPPPPPPFGMLPQPPPCPSLTPISSAQASTSKPHLICNNIPKPTKPVKQLNWQHFSATVNEQSIWKDINENYDSVEFDYNLLEDLFSKPKRPNSSVTPINKASSVTVKQAHPDAEFTSFLDAKTSMGLSIFLKKTRKWSMDDLVNLIRRGRSKELTLDSLACLKKILPEKSEVDDIQAFCRENPDNESHLAEADHFIKLLSDVPRYELRISLMNFLEEFDEMYSRLESPLKIYDDSAQVIMENESLREILSMILRMGNYLNANSYKGNTNAFKMTSLNHLQELKASKAGLTSLHFLVEQFENNHSGDERCFSFLGDLKEIGSILNYGYTSLTNDLNVLKRNLTELSGQISQDQTPEDIKSQFLNRFKNFNTKLVQLTETFTRVERSKQAIIDLYGEDPATFNLDEFLKIFYEFSVNVNKARDDNKQRHSNEEKVAKRKTDLNQSDGRRISKTDLPDDNELVKEMINGGLSSMLSNLKKGHCTRPSMRGSDDERVGFKLPGLGSDTVKLKNVNKRMF